MALYQPAIDTLVPVSSPEAAELVKILENTFRSVNIGLVNEMAIVCDKLGVDVWEVIEAAATKPFGFMKFTPGPGVGGHCIPLDPHYLAWKMRTLNYRTRFIELAGEINAEMPEYWVARVVDRLNDNSKAVRGSRVLILGVAYKKDIDDIRESPALDVIRLLHQRGAEVVYHDPHVARVRDDGLELASVALDAATLRCADEGHRRRDGLCRAGGRRLPGRNGQRRGVRGRRPRQDRGSAAESPAHLRAGPRAAGHAQPARRPPALRHGRGRGRAARGRGLHRGRHAS
jgi:UDP-N-acetyl-D-glucosamine dehydrogenase